MSSHDSEHDELNSQLAAAESRELAQIDNALQSIREGSYGVCESCASAIPLARLEAIPYATLCIKCQRAAESEVRPERGLVTAPHFLEVSGPAAGQDYAPEYELH